LESCHVAVLVVLVVGNVNSLLELLVWGRRRRRRRRRSEDSV
jgi:hypothetical protein